jgi:hypothetical protein
MHKELKHAIVKYIMENENEFQLHNSAAKLFRNYIYDENGSYLIGCEIVSKFIGDAIKLLTL